MGRLGAGGEPFLPEDQKGYNLPEQLLPSVSQQFGATFSEAYHNSPGVMAINRAVLELPALQKAMPNAGRTMSIDEANQKYGLKLKPTFTNQITEGMADNLYRREMDKHLNEHILQRSSVDPVSGFGVGLAAGFADPLNILMGYLPATRGLVAAKNYAQEAGAAGTLFPSAFRNARAVLNTNTTLSKLNPFMVGAIDNSAITALTTPLQLSNAQALGQEYRLEDAVADIAISGTVGGILHAGMGAVFGHNYGRTYNTSRAKNLREITPDQYARAESDFANGRPVDVQTPKESQELLDKVTGARQKFEQEILSEDARQAFVDETGMVENPSNRLSAPMVVVEQKFKPFVHGSPKPRYRNTTLKFDSDIDLALYIIKNRDVLSNADNKFVDFVKEALPNLSEEQIAELADNVKNHVRNSVSQAGEGGEVRVPRFFEGKGRELFDPLSNEKPPRKARPLDLSDEQVADHATTLEHNLAEHLDDPVRFKESLTNHLNDLMTKITSLSELEALPEEKRVLAEPDTQRTKWDIIQHLGDANELVPETERAMVDDQILETSGFTKTVREETGKRISSILDKLTQDIDDNQRIDLLTEEHGKAAKELKTALAKLEEYQSKGSGDAVIKRWKEKVAARTLTTAYTDRLLKSQGIDPGTPEFTLAHHLQTFGDALPPALKEFTEANPDTLQDPLYRVQRQIQDNLASRMKETEDYLKSLDYSKPVTKYPEDIRSLQESRQYLQERGNVTPEDLHEAALQDIQKQIQEAKSLGIFNEAEIARFDRLNEEYKLRLDKTDAVKKGALQAQICALGGIE